MEHWATILDALEAGIQGDKEKCRAYAELWREKLQADGETRIATHLQRILEGKRGARIHLMNMKTHIPTKDVTTSVFIGDLAISVTHPEWWDDLQLQEWVELVVQDAPLVEVGKRITLEENEVPDLAYDEGGNVPITVTELIKLQKYMG